MISKADYERLIYTDLSGYVIKKQRPYFLEYPWREEPDGNWLIIDEYKAHGIYYVRIRSLAEPRKVEHVRKFAACSCILLEVERINVDEWLSINGLKRP